MLSRLRFWRAYADEHSCYIAVVSHDTDLKKACDRFSSLMFFQSLPALTELLLSVDDGRVATFRSALDRNIEKLSDAAYEATIDLSFYHSNDHSAIDNSEVSDLSLDEVRIVALGQHECTVAFDAQIEVRHRVEWTEPGLEEEYERRRETVVNQYAVSGTAKLSFDTSGQQLVSIPFVALDDDEIEARDIPPFWGRWR
jgi:hypothetical protein